MTVKNRYQLIKEGFDIVAAGGRKARMVWDDPNSRLSWYIGSTEIARMDATNGISDVVGGALSFAGSITAFAGGGQASATAITASENDVTTVASNFDSVKLPVPVAGRAITIRNSGASILSVFPSTGVTINGLAVNLSIDVGIGAAVTFRGISATAWKSSTTVSLPSPSTQKGSLAIKAADNAGNTQTIITNASQAAARTYTLPDGGANSIFVVNPVAAALATNTITAFAGGGQGSAVALTSQFNRISVCATAGDSVRLPVSVAGGFCVVINNGAAAAQVYGAGSETIDGIATATGQPLPVNAMGIYTCEVAGNWNSNQGIPLLGAKYGTAANTTGFTATGAQVGGADKVVLNLTGALGAGANIQLPTVAQLVAAIPNAQIGESYYLRILNLSSGAFAWTVTTNTGWTLNGTMTIAQNFYREFVVTLNSIAAATLQSVGTVAQSAV